ncbi:hypothetical protein BOX15_Mlig014270g2, partial [Macrostomum lignano]
MEVEINSKRCSRDTDSPPTVSTKKVNNRDSAGPVRRSEQQTMLSPSNAPLPETPPGTSKGERPPSKRGSLEIRKSEGVTTIIRLPKPDKSDSKTYNLSNNCNISYHSSALTKCDNQILKILVDEIQAKAFHHHTNGRPEARKIVWFGPEYTYGGTKISANDNWHPLVTSLATWLSVEYQLPVFNSCLINFYKDGSINIPWHSDDEVELGPNPTIASISIGAARDFHMRPKGSTNIAWSQRLASGSLLIMSGATQSHFQHAVLKDPKVKDLRVNLTFRLTRDGRIPEDLPVSDQANPCVLPVDSSITCDLDDEDSVRRRAELEAENLRRIRSRSNSSTGRKPSSQQPITQSSEQATQITKLDAQENNKQSTQRSDSAKPQQPATLSSNKQTNDTQQHTNTQQAHSATQQPSTKPKHQSSDTHTQKPNSYSLLQATNQQANTQSQQSSTHSQQSGTHTQQPDQASQQSAQAQQSSARNQQSKLTKISPVVFEMPVEAKNPIKFESFLKTNFPNIRIMSVKELYHSSGYLVFTNSPSDMNNLLTTTLKTNEINGHTVTRRLPSNRPLHQGDDRLRKPLKSPQVRSFIVKGVPLAVEAEELLEYLDENQAHLQFDGATRIISKASGQPTHLIRMFTKSRATYDTCLENGIRLGALKFRCEESHNLPPVKEIQCQRCQGLGHSESRCNAGFVCNKCAGAHFSGDCPKDTGFRCANCGGEHPAYSFKCQVVQHANERATENEHHRVQTLKLKLAQSRYLEPTQSLVETFGLPGPASYAEAVSQVPTLGPIAYKNKASKASDAAAAAATVQSAMPPTAVAAAPVQPALPITAAAAAAAQSTAPLDEAATKTKMPAMTNTDIAATSSAENGERGFTQGDVLEVVLGALNRIMEIEPGRLLTAWEASQLAIRVVTEVLTTFMNPRRVPAVRAGEAK